MQPTYVTGSSGVLGFEILRHLSAQGAGPVTGVARRPLPETGEGLLQITTPEVLHPAWLEGKDATVIHCAGLSDARASFGSIAELTQRMVLPQVTMVEALLARGWRGHFVYLSSAAVYGDAEVLPIPETQQPAPRGFYALHKLAVEEALAFLAAHHGFPLTILRIANPYGTSLPRRERGVLRLLLAAAEAGSGFTVYGSGEGLRDYLHISDFLSAVRRVRERPPERAEGWVRRLNLGSGQGTSLNELIARVEAATGREIATRREPSTLEVGSNVLDIARAQAALDWTPSVPLDEGVARMAEDFARQAEPG
ncbi:UDP-glucose 4-epimerase [Salipiger mucosus DSM 16094]|uniref:UDP-glucose 4-epimerase n=1 Tax=Salipiger mucosus DSM 16094 TaxID=1123237 RepID=S9RCS8_9RHOB|nr:UDP-glucose 4-epimerase [Salipiger mucosus DSM 16094]